MVAGRNNDVIESRRKYVEAWNNTMLKIWKDRIELLHVRITDNLLKSPIVVNDKTGNFDNIHSFNLTQQFLEYGLWVDLGVGRETPHGNPGDIGREKVRMRKRWFSLKYYSSVMNLRDFMAESLGREFIGMFANLDASDQRAYTDYYKDKGWS